MIARQYTKTRQAGLGSRPRPNVRERVEGQTTLQEQQKRETRERILEATKTVLSRRSYASMAVEDVVIEAKISRATFYRHFDSKFAIFVELLERFSVPMYDIYFSLAKSSAPSLKDLTSWVERLIDLHAAEKLLVGAFQQMMAIEHDFRFHADRMSLTICENLGKTIPAFRKAHSDSHRDSRARTEAWILLTALTDVCAEVAVFTWPIDKTAAAKILAEHFHSFITANK